ncbi:hypothetical protein LMG29542_08529 [Paraburkholderia humisilvae]|uniref:Uncharacterized protein n=1 Tax=Paraburkholderia humisilvae TaxID=627669 RepID=A0A6J5FCG5_9BURK|nr:hypothetical protein LMG29542_08529 [Paraburkholderia humisilvae]
MPNRVKVGAQIKVYDAGLTLNNRRRHPMHRFMRGTLGTISVRPRLEVCLEDRLQYELERALNHTVTDSRNRKDTDLAPVLRYFLPPRS